ncbi:proteoglycan 4b isoform X2 [Scleropages formosus]|uniref:proteoglycan 4b isoform X2 n=1 Tax=Scleropages formosus TaxID=113540 RepID=UPI0010FAC384|nr:proteoglycan 4 isoform X2 [Scleropages formosus]
MLLSFFHQRTEMVCSGTLFSVVLLACFLPFCSGQASCTNRCGETYFRGHVCHCDYDCLIHDECCKDYERTCTTSDSCKGRCGETFKRGRQCNCDPECTRYNQCCPDYEAHCGKVTTTRAPATTIPTYKNPKKDKPTEPPKKIPTEKPAMKGPVHTKGPQPEETDSRDQDFSVDGFIMTTHFPPANQQELQEQGDEAIDNVTPEVLGQLAEVYSSGPTISLDNMSGNEPLQTDLPEDASPQESISPSFNTPASETEEEVMEQMEIPLLRNQSFNDTGNGQVSAVFSASGSPTQISATTPNRFYSHDLQEQGVAEPANSDIKLTAEGEASSLNSKPTGQTPQGLEEVTPLSQEDSPSSTKSTMQDLPSSKPSKEGVASENQISEKLHVPEAPLTTAVTDKPKAKCTGERTPSPRLASNNSALTDSPESMSTDHSKWSPTPDQSSALGGPSPSTVLNGAKDDVCDTSSDTSPTVATGKEVLSPRTDAYAMFEAGDITSTAFPQPTTPGLVPEPTVMAPQDKAESRMPLSRVTTTAPISKPVQPVQTDDTNAMSTANPPEYLADDNNDTNLCSGRPINGLTTLRNGTIVVFRGHYFWMLDANRVPGPARGITEVWGIPSPIDTVFTRCNCQHKTYFFKGYRYWRFENDVMDPGYPKTISDGFSRLSGRITAALSVPQNSRRPESVFFFKRGGLMQRYSYQHGTSPNCGKKTKYMVVTARNRKARQAEDGLHKEIKITWKGFPSFVTSAISIPTPMMTEGYDYYVFSRTKYYNIKIDGDTPALASPVTAASQQNSAKSFFKCP